MNTNSFKVYVYTASYNHSQYIKAALDGFCMQKTNFPYVCAIKDDASTDGEQAIIIKYIEDNFDTSGDLFYTEETDYANIIFARHKENKNCHIAAVLLKYNHYSIHKPVEPYFERWRTGVPYMALCEGDDYWIDPLKLQKQVDRLESTPDDGLVYAYTKVQGLEGNQREGSKYSETELEKLLVTGYVPTCTVVYRLDAYKRYIDEVNLREKKWLQGDLPLVLWFAANSKIHCFKEDFGVYRIVPGSASHPFSVERAKKMRESELNVRLFFDKTYNGGRLNLEIYDWYNRILLQITLYQERSIKNAIDSFLKISQKQRKDYILLLRGILSNIKYVFKQIR